MIYEINSFEIPIKTMDWVKNLSFRQRQKTEREGVTGGVSMNLVFNSEKLPTLSTSSSSAHNDRLFFPHYSNIHKLYLLTYSTADLQTLRDQQKIERPSHDSISSSRRLKRQSFIIVDLGDGDHPHRMENMNI